MPDQEAFDLLVGHPFLRGRDPDPDLQPGHRSDAGGRQAAHVRDAADARRRGSDQPRAGHHPMAGRPRRLRGLNSFSNIRLTLLVTYSGITDAADRAGRLRHRGRLARTAYEHAERYRVVLYWRPLVPGLNDTDQHISRAMELTRYAHATVFTGLFYRDEIRGVLPAHGLPEPYEHTARRKIVPGGSSSASSPPRPPDRVDRRCSARPSARSLRPRDGRLQRSLRHPGAVRHLPGRAGRALCPGRGHAPDPAPIAATVAGLGGELVADHRPGGDGDGSGRAAPLPAAAHPRLPGPRRRPSRTTSAATAAPTSAGRHHGRRRHPELRAHPTAPAGRWTDSGSWSSTWKATASATGDRRDRRAPDHRPTASGRGPADVAGPPAAADHADGDPQGARHQQRRRGRLPILAQIAADVAAASPVGCWSPTTRRWNAGSSPRTSRAGSRRWCWTRCGWPSASGPACPGYGLERLVPRAITPPPVGAGTAPAPRRLRRPDDRRSSWSCSSTTRAERLDWRHRAKPPSQLRRPRQPHCQ